MVQVINTAFYFAAIQGAPLQAHLVPYFRMLPTTAIPVSRVRLAPAQAAHICHLRHRTGCAVPVKRNGSTEV